VHQVAPGREISPGPLSYHYRNLARSAASRPACNAGLISVQTGASMNWSREDFRSKSPMTIRAQQTGFC